MNEASLSVSKLDFAIKKRVILKDVAFKVSIGSVFAVVGHNGAGKTTLFHLILGLKIQTGGEILLLGKSNLDFKARAKLGYVPERPYVQLEQTLRAFLLFHVTLIGLSSAQRKLEVERVSREVQLEKHLDHLLSTFSKGMLQKSLIAQASLGSPDLYLLDEPMSGLDPDAREAVRGQILRLKQQKKTIIFSSHALEDVEQLSDEVLILKDGRAEFLGTVADWKRTR
ncbi:MAG: ABC transporter ATP-binding protein [Bdellovibrionales bacterium]|nr:ABC transporter ATP-binding protein [Oligoflexia bacterium]